MSCVFHLPCELRLLVTTCAKTQLRYCSTSRPLFKLPSTDSSPASFKRGEWLVENQTAVQPQKTAGEVRTPAASAQQAADSTQLVPGIPPSREVGHPRKSEVPARVLPKANITRDVTLTPKERLQMEFLTRKQPRHTQRQLFRDKLLIYHAGLGAEHGLVFSKAFTLMWLCVTLFIVAPAYYVYGDPLWKVAGIVLIGVAPVLILHWATKNFVTWIYLPLPTYARQSAKTAMEYAKNLPATANLLIDFKRLHAWPGTAEVKVIDLMPAQRSFPLSTFRLATRRVDQGPWYSPNPIEFYVREHSAKHGRAAKDTIPGIWEQVYRRIMGKESETVGKWKR